MHAKSLVPILAEIYGVPQETAFMIDRSLSECGYRAKGRGKSFPEMTRREAVIFLLACMVAQKATKAGMEVKPWVEATGYLEDEPDDQPLDVEFSAPSEPTFFNSTHMRKVFHELGSVDRLNLVDFLLALCPVLDADRIECRLEISVSHGWAAVALEGDPKSSKVIFQTDEGAVNPTAYEAQINRSSIVYGDALLALTTRTEKD